VRFGDAVAFADWLTARHGGNAVYRLPTQSEATQYAIVKVAPLAAWCLSDGVQSLVGLTDEQERSYRGELQSWGMLPLLAIPEAYMGRSSLRGNKPDCSDFSKPATFRSNVDLAIAISRALDLDSGYARALADAIADSFTYLEPSWIDDDEMSDSAIRPFDAARRIANKLDVADNAAGRRQVLLRYVAVLTGRAWDGPAYTISRRWHRRLFVCILRGLESLLRAKGSDETAKRILMLHWWANLMLARMAGRLPAWEGIRLVRERTT
jgi:hypothetical protein